jgi:hypothetical protein
LPGGTLNAKGVFIYMKSTAKFFFFILLEAEIGYTIACFGGSGGAK